MLGELLDPCVQGPSVGVSTQDVPPEDPVNSLGSGRSGWGISCHFSGQAGPCILKLRQDVCLLVAASWGAAAGSLYMQGFE